MRSSRSSLAALLAWLVTMLIAVAPAPAKSASREKFSDTVASTSQMLVQALDAAKEECPYGYDFASGDSFYNYFRDYNPQTGRYQQSDPIGQYDGPNTYVYVDADPQSYFDNLGLRAKGGTGFKRQHGGCEFIGVPQRTSGKNGPNHERKTRNEGVKMAMRGACKVYFHISMHDICGNGDKRKPDAVGVYPNGCMDICEIASPIRAIARRATK